MADTTASDKDFLGDNAKYSIVSSYNRKYVADATGEVGAAACGDIMKITLKIDDVTQRVIDARFKTFGCGSAIAASSMATELIKGRTIEELQKNFNNDNIVDALGGLPPVKIHCSVLATEALNAALEDYKKRKGI